MALFMGNKVTVILGTTTVSSNVSTVALNREVDTIETTAQNDTVQNFAGGIERSNLTIDFYQDFAAGNVNALIEAAFGSKLNVKLVPVTGTISSTNPSYSMSCLVSQYTPINGSTDGVMTQAVTWPITAISVATS
jgi:hypothetical protein